MIATCENCSKEYKTLPSWYKKANHHYCSRPCAFEGTREARTEHINKIGVAHRFKPGHTPSKNRKMQKGEEHYAWKGEKVGYRGLHYWLRRVKGSPAECQHCTTIKSVQWASKDGTYPRDPNHYFPLCASCHKKYDLALATQDA